MSFAKPQRGLVPIGGNFYATPDEPQEANYDNPFASPVGMNGIRPPIGVEIQVVRDECNIGIQYNAVLLFMRLPSFQLLLRNPDCTPTLASPQQPGSTTINKEQKVPPPNPCSSNYGGIYFRMNTRYSLYTEFIVGGYDDIMWNYFRSEFKFKRYYKQEGILEFLVSYQVGFDKYSQTVRTKLHRYYWGQVVLRGVTEDDQRFLARAQKPGAGSFSSDIYIDFYDGYDTMIQYQNSLSSYTKNHKEESSGEFLRYKLGAFGTKPDPPTIETPIRSYSFSLLTEYPIVGGYQYTYKGTLINTEESVADYFLFCGDYEELPPGIVPPPPIKNKPKEPCCMCNDQISKLLLKRLGDFPVKVPELLNTGNNKDKVIQIDSIGAMLAWLARNLDASLGEFPLNIKIEDSDLTKDGNQEIVIKPPNIAETLAEILGLLLVIKTEGGATLKTGLNTMIETGSIRQTVASNYDYLDAIAEYLGFQVKQINKTLPLAFTPGKEKLDELLDPSTLKYKTIENVDKKDINDSLAPLLEMAARWNAQNFRNLGSSNPKGSLRDLLINGAKIGKEVIDLVNLEKVKNNDIDLIPESTFNQFLRDTEVQFQNTPGVTDVVDPWGNDYANRPRLVQAGKSDQGDQ